jgi:predicted MFS family arabinose efflux permease
MSVIPDKWKTPEVCIVLLAAVYPLSFSVWMSLLNNFTIEQANFTGIEIGLLQSIREIPGLLAFTVLAFIIIFREQSFILFSLILLGIGVFITGYFPYEMGLYITTIIMSFGFHYAEALQMSLTLQWVPKDKAPENMGCQISSKAIASLLAYAVVWVSLEVFNLDYKAIYIIGGAMTIALALVIWAIFPKFPEQHPQKKKIILRKRYWLFYALTFMGGARRQIFMVFAGFLLVERFGFSAALVTALYLANHLISFWTAPLIGRLVKKWGERRALTVEYIGLIIVFTGYALAPTAWIAGVLYVLDHLFFALAIAQKSYLQKIANPSEISSTSSVSFSINHIAAVFLPALLGMVWMSSPEAVFLTGTGMAFISLILSLYVPNNPEPGNEVRANPFRRRNKEALPQSE